MSRLHDLAANGQAIWLDFIHRRHTMTGELARLRDLGVRGVTSNPAIFEKAIGGGSPEYEHDLRTLIGRGASLNDIYEGLAFADIQEAAMVLRPVYDESGGADGFVSIEVDPALAHDTEATVLEALRIAAAVDEPNVMIKIPATPAGIPAIRAVIAEGVNVNVTLIFSTAQYIPVANAYIEGLEARAAAGEDISKVASVASFFVSRVDTLVDKKLEALGRSDLAGKAAVANARVAYGAFRALFSGPRWEALEAEGARVQRPLWASTGTKNPAYSDCLYVDTLVAADTVNTLPPATLDAVLDHGETRPAIDGAIDGARALLAELGSLGIDVDGAIAEELQRDGVKQFVDAFATLMSSIERRQQRQVFGFDRSTFQLVEYAERVDAALTEVAEGNVTWRIFGGDHEAFSAPGPDEVANRIGWIDVPEEILVDHIDDIEAFAGAARADGFTTAVVIGMGGSSLAPEVFATTLAGAIGLRVVVADSTHPGAVQALLDSIDIDQTLFLVSTKSGGTVETFSLFRFFWRQVVARRGNAAGRQFVAITDPGSALATLAAALDFRHTPLNNPDIGGRFSALSHFGMVPAALSGAPIRSLLRGAIAARDVTRESDSGSAPGLLGVAIAELAKAGRDKLTLVVTPELEPFGAWFEQLIAESTGKQGKGVLPVPVTSVGRPDSYGADRVFVHLRMVGDARNDEAMMALAAAGHPVVTMHLQSMEALGTLMWAWEFATAMAGHRLAINPFDQPNVESAKVQARAFVAEYQRTGVLPALTPTVEGDGFRVFGETAAPDVAAALRAFLASADRVAVPAPYVSVQAFLNPSPANREALAALQTCIEGATGLATTAGFGPRFLHSTGQLHKGDAGHGLFLQLVDSPSADLPIPDDVVSDTSSMTFGTLIAAQALGDRQALLDAGRHVLRIELPGDTASAMGRLATFVAGD